MAALVLVLVLLPLVRWPVVSPVLGRGGEGATRTSVVIAGEEFSLLVADDPVARYRGLGGRDRLAANEGMIFLGLHSARPAMTMRDMRFDLDIVWLGPDDRIVHVVSRADRLRPSVVYVNPRGTVADRVIELPAGTCERVGIAVGDRVQVG